MIKVKSEIVQIEEIEKAQAVKVSSSSIAIRPDVVEAKVYKLKSGFVKHSVYVTLGYIVEEGRKRPIEIFINSKDLTKAPEYSVLTRLISAIFRKSSDPTFILEELKSIYDPNGGYLKHGKYIHSLYAEIADVIEQFFVDIGVMEKASSSNGFHKALNGNGQNNNDNSNGGIAEDLSVFKICPECQEKTLKFENGCLVCVHPDCGYSKCDK